MIQLERLSETNRPAFETLLSEIWQQNWNDQVAKSIVQWRYYDRPADAVTWLAMEHNACVGMLDSMLRPYLLDGHRILVRETADWYCIPQQRGILGLRLLWCLNSCPEPVFVMGGSETTRRILSQMRDWTNLPATSSYILPHYCPEFSERTASKYLTYNGFSAIYGGVDLKAEVASRTLFRGGRAHVRRKDGFFSADGLPPLEHTHAAGRALSWRFLGSNIALRRTVPSDGICPTDVPRKPARH